MHGVVSYFEQTFSFNQGLYIIFQMDWKRYIIVLMKYLQSSLRLEVYLIKLLLWYHNYGRLLL